MKDSEKLSYLFRYREQDSEPDSEIKDKDNKSEKKTKENKPAIQR